MDCLTFLLPGGSPVSSHILEGHAGQSVPGVVYQDGQPTAFLKEIQPSGQPHIYLGSDHYYLRERPVPAQALGRSYDVVPQLPTGSPTGAVHLGPGGTITSDGLGAKLTAALVSAIGPRTG